MSQRSSKMNRRIDKCESRLDNLEERWDNAARYAANERYRTDRKFEDLRTERRTEAEYRRKRDRVNRFLIGVLVGMSVAVIVVLMESINADAVENSVDNVETPVQVVGVSQERVEEEVEDYENQKIEDALLAKATRIDDVIVTHYCICKKCCGKSPDNPAYGITASGRKATPGVSVAVDPELIPLGADIMVDYGDGEIHYYKSDDTGSAVKGNHIDLCMGSHEEALNAGVQKATLWWSK